MPFNPSCLQSHSGTKTHLCDLSSQLRDTVRDTDKLIKLRKKAHQGISVSRGNFEGNGVNGHEPENSRSWSGRPYGSPVRQPSFGLSLPRPPTPHGPFALMVGAADPKKPVPFSNNRNANVPLPALVPYAGSMRRYPVALVSIRCSTTMWNARGRLRSKRFHRADCRINRSDDRRDDC